MYNSGVRPVNRQRPLLLLAGLFLAALTLRPQLVGIGPLLSTIQRSLGVSHSVAGLLSTAVVLCMGLFAPVAYLISGRVGPRWAIGGALALVGGFGILRLVVSPAGVVIAFTIPIGIGTAVAGSLMPLVVRESWHGRPVLATAVYATGINLGAAAAAAAAVPLSNAYGSWRAPLAVFSIVAAAMTVVWLGLSHGYGERATAAQAVPLSRLPLGNRTAWLLATIFGLVSLTYYGVNAWLPSAFTERGWSHASAGVLLTVLNGVTVPVGIFLATRGDRFGSRRFWLAAGAGFQLVGLLGVIVAPGAGFAWAAMLGAAIGLLFPSMMTMPLDVADRPEEVGTMAALMLGGGYTVSALGPFLLGVIRDQAGSFTLAIWMLFALTAVVLIIALTTTHERLRRPPRRAALMRQLTVPGRGEDLA
jgi:MFS transporter, CP family, cyanate transporter